MKKAALFVSGLLLSALACTPAMAETVRVRLTARVNQVSDSQGALNGKIVQGTRLTGTYVYNTNTPNQSPPGSSIGEYQPYANEARVRIAGGGFVFENVAPTQGIHIRVADEHYTQGEFHIISLENKPLSNGAPVNGIELQFSGNGNVTQSTALPTVAPALIGYYIKELRINGAGFQLAAAVESAELIVADTVEVSPASGSFLPNQEFDAAVILPRNSNVVNVVAKANGTPLPIGYPGYCALFPQNGANRPALLCPNANVVLPHAAGAPIEWTIELSNGTVLTETSNWTIAH